MPDPCRLHILGGGMSSLVTAFALTNSPDWRNRFESITVYQQGWRLGGKGASGRNDAKHQRIEEHGLHVLFGCYENTFKLMRRCLDELPNGWRWPFPPWKFDDAFQGEPGVTLIAMYERPDQQWKHWDVEAPRREGAPGDGPPIPWGPGNALELLYAWAKSFAERWQAEVDVARAAGGRAGASPEPVPVHFLEKALKSVSNAVDRTTGEFKPGALEPVGADVDEHAEKFLRWMDTQPTLADRIRRWAIIIEFALRTANGLRADGAIRPERAGDEQSNWFVIDGLDLRAWLEKHGTKERTRNSALVQGLYDAVFTWNAEVGAGTILHALLRASFYKGAVLYRMQAGMGDTIFAPLYHVLKERGVEFRFFHRVENLALSADRSRVASVRFERQAKLANAEYEPLVPVKKVPCWPNGPRLDQLSDEDKQNIPGHDLEDWWDPRRGKSWNLVLGEDDLLVLGISIGAFPYICRELMDNPDQPDFEEMVSAVATAQTQAAQLWMTAGLKKLGWKRKLPIVIPYAEPFDTWADMTHLKDREEVPVAVQNIAYLCSSLDDEEPPPPRTDHGYPARQRERVLKNARRWLEDSSKVLWPSTRRGPNFDWRLLYVWPDGQNDPLRGQHYCAVTNPSDRYVRAIPGSNAQRLMATQSGYSNLVMTGDWIKTAMSVGCLEAATMAGLQTARALDPSVPKAIYDWLPDPPPIPMAIDRVATRKYIRRDAELLVVPPVMLDIVLRGFVLKADPAVLQAVCDRELNLGGVKRYRPAGGFVMLYCADMDHTVPEGTIGGSEFGVWVPVFKVDENNNARQILTYSPYLWVNSSAALVGGRAVYGFPKHMGTLTIPKPGEPARFAVDTETLLLQHGTAATARLFDIRRPGATTWEKPTTSWTIAQIERIVRALLGNVANPGTLTWSLVQQLLEPTKGMPMLFLKQFPEGNSSWDACYQALLEGPIEIVNQPTSGPIPGDWVVDFRRYWSHRIVERLGLEVVLQPDGNGGRVDRATALASVWMAFKSRVAPATVVWPT